MRKPEKTKEMSTYGRLFKEYRRLDRKIDAMIAQRSRVADKLAAAHNLCQQQEAAGLLKYAESLIGHLCHYVESTYIVPDKVEVNVVGEPYVSLHGQSVRIISSGIEYERDLWIRIQSRREISLASTDKYIDKIECMCNMFKTIASVSGGSGGERAPGRKPARKRA